MNQASTRKVSMANFDRSISSTGALSSQATQLRKRWLRTVSTISGDSVSDSFDSIAESGVDDLAKSVTEKNNQTPLSINER